MPCDRPRRAGRGGRRHACGVASPRKSFLEECEKRPKASVPLLQQSIATGHIAPEESGSRCRIPRRCTMCAMCANRCSCRRCARWEGAMSICPATIERGERGVLATPRRPKRCSLKRDRGHHSQEALAQAMTCDGVSDRIVVDDVASLGRLFVRKAQLAAPGGRAAVQPLVIGGTCGVEQSGTGGCRGRAHASSLGEGHPRQDPRCKRSGTRRDNSLNAMLHIGDERWPEELAAVRASTERGGGPACCLLV